MYYKIFRWFSSLILALAIASAGFSPALAAPPSNDNFADAEVINSLPFSATSDLTESTIEADELKNCSMFLNQSVWYSFTPTETMNIRVDTLGSAAGVIVGVYRATATGISDLQNLTCVYTGSSSTFLAEAEQIYYLQASPNGGAGTVQINLQQVFPPANDFFDNAEVVTSLPFSASPDITDTGFETGESTTCGFIQRTVWYSFTPTETMNIRVDTLGGAVNGIVGVYRATGTGLSNLQHLTCVYSFSSTSSTFLAEAEQTYYLQASPNGGNGTIQINLQQVFLSPPANDNFTDAEVITSLPYSATVDARDATRETNEITSCGYSVKTVWYSFTPAQNMAVQVNTSGSATANYLSIYASSGPGFSDLTFLGCRGNGSSLNFAIEAEKTYYLQIDADPLGSGTIQVNMEQLLPPANDNFANAEVITSLPYSATVDIMDSTFEPGEITSCGNSNKTVWYSFTPTQNMAIRVDTLGSATANYLNVYAASGPGFSNLTFLGCQGNGSPFDFQADAQKTYYLQIDANPLEDGTIHVNMVQIFPPTNDNFANAKTISALPFDDTLDISTSTIEPTEPTSSCAYYGPSAGSVWYAFIPTKTKSFSMSSPSAPFTPVFTVYTGNSLTGLTQVGCQSNGGNLLTLKMNAGTKYYIQVGKLYPWEPGGSMQFHLEAAPLPVASFSYYPSDASVFDVIQFYDQSYDPAQAGFQSYEWKFGDGTTSTEQYPTHQYTKNKDYTVKLKVTTTDGRTASFSQTIHVETHDVSINKFEVPKSTKAGKSEPITITVRNATVNNETVTIDLYKSVAGGSYEFVATLTKTIPGSSKGNQTAKYTFNYTFTSADAATGKVVFHAIATIQNFRDAFPLDNDRLSTATIVKKK